jgi:predicted dehydrogenase
MGEVRTISMGLIGLGFIGKLHAQACRSIPVCFPKPQVLGETKALLRSHMDGDEALLAVLGNPLVTTDMETFLRQPIEVVDICTPNYLHEEQAVAAAKAGKHIYCEKPLGCNVAEVQRMAAAAKQAGVQTHSAFTLRYIPAVAQMKALLNAGAIGNPLHFRGVMYHSSYLDKNRPMSWRLREADSGGGAWMDLGAHMLDMSRYLMGDIGALHAQMRTFISQRPLTAGSASYGTVDVDDWCLCDLEMQNGAVGSLEVSRVAGGTGEDTTFEIFGSKGSLRLNVSKPETVNWYDFKRKQWINGPIDLPLEVNGRPLETIWPSYKFSLGRMVNGHMASLYDFLLCIAEGKPSMLNFETALRTQEALEAANLSHKKGGVRIDLPIYS